MQFWSELIPMISNRTRAVRSFDFQIMRMISDQIALHSVQKSLLKGLGHAILDNFSINQMVIELTEITK